MPYETQKHSFTNLHRFIHLITVIYFLIFQSQCFNFKQVGRNSVSKIINQRTSYSFVLDRTTDNNGVTTAWNTTAVPSNGNVSVQFPSQYVLTGTQTCTSILIVSGITNVQTFSPTQYSCAVSGNQIIFTGALSSISDLYIRNITLNYGNVLNPSPAVKTGEFTGYLGDDVAVANGNTNVQLSPATFTNCYITFGNGSYVNQTSPAIFNLTLLNQLNSSSSIRINFPSSKVWTNDISQSILPVQTGTMSCTGLLNDLTNPTCTGNYTAFTVIASSIFSTSISSGQMASFEINNFVSPPSLQPADSIKITSLTNGYQVDTCTTTVSGLKPKQFQNLTIVPISGQMIVNSNVGIRINMTFSDTVDQNDSFRVTFPSGLGVTFSSVSTSGSSEGVSSLNGQVLSVSQNVNFNVIYYKDYFMVINFYTMTAPPSTKISDPITVELLRNGYQKMIGTATVQATASTLQCSVSPQNTLISTQTLYVFSITLNDKLSSGGWLEIFFPSDIVLNGNVSIASGTGTNINSNPVISIDSILGKVTVISLNSSTSFINTQTFTLTIGTITNPGSTKPTGTFSIKSYYQSGSDYLVAIGTCNGITAVSGILKSSDISISKSSDVVLASNIDYTISFVTGYAIPKNGIIKIEIPNDVGIDLANLQSNCYQTVNTSSLLTATCTAILNTTTNKYQLTVNSIALTSNLTGNSTISILLQGICTNPDTTRNVIGFTINTYTSDGFLIQGANTGISTRASTPAQCVSVTVSRGSNKNSDTTNYTISLKQPSNLSPSSYLIITIPIELQLTNTTSCVDLTGTQTLLYTVSSNVITVTLTASSVSNFTLFGVILTNVINTPNFQPLNQNFNILTKTPDNLNKYCQYSNPFVFQNNIPSLFSSINGTFTPRIYNQLTSLIVNFTPSTRLIPTYLMVSIATELIVESLTCSFQGIVSGICTQNSTNTIKVQGTFTTNPMQFTIGGIKAPKFSSLVPQYSSVSSFSASDYEIDEVVNLISFAVKCTLPCKTCSDTNLSSCLSCYQDITISTSIYYLSSLQSCFSVCPDGYFADTSVLSCTACNSICNTCSMISSNCTTCKTNSTYKYFYLSSNSTTGTCLSQCPTYYYPNSVNNCTPCQSPCNDCTSKTNCISCLSPYYMFNGSCTSQCPSGTTIPNDATRNCDLCSSVCATCSGNINSCVTCSASAAFYNGTCVSSCPPPLVINAGQCGNCDSICKQCSIRATNCTKCDTSSSYPYYYNYTCLSDCPSGYYKDLLNGMCNLCSDLNIGCRFCSSVSTCISCDSGFIFLNNKCYNYTPSGYYNNNSYAVPCSGDCATCVDYATKCTSCKTLNLDGYDCVANCSSTKVPMNKTCVSCQSPCLTCSNIPTNCTSCLPNLTPQVFLNNYYCTSTCPDYTYPNLTISKCDSCQSPCLQCTSLSSCTSCVNGKYLLGTSCLDLCPNGYIGINKICQPCTAPCMTCQITQTRCLSCQVNYYLYNSSSPSCVQDCFTVNLYPNPTLQICTGCQSPCVTCSTTSTTCTSCSQAMILFNSSCISSCPSGLYQQASSCIACPTPCSTCTSSTVCQSCVSSYYFLLNYCVNSCPQEYPVITSDGKCQKCSDTKCNNCTQNDYCQECMQPYFLYLGTCVERCPTDYNQTINSTSNFRSCVYIGPAITPNSTEQTIVQTLKSGGNLFPVPLIIVSAFIGVATIMSKFQNHFTFISGVLYSLWGITEWAAVALMLWYFYQSYGWKHIEFYILGGSFAFLYVLNFLAILIQNIYLLGDANFNKWLTMGHNRCVYFVVSIISFFTTHKFKNFIFSKMFNFVFLKAKLDSVQQFRVFNAFSFLSFLSSAGILFGMGLTFWTYQQVIDQRLMFFIDATVLTAVNIVLAILNSRKDPQFFEQKNEDGFTIHKRIEDYDELLNGGIIPYESQQKYDHYETTGKKLLGAYQSRYKHYQSEISQDSVRVMDISVQAEQILGEQSIITHLNDDDMSGLDFFQRKQVSIQHDHQPEVHDKSISMMKFDKQVHDQSVSMMQVKNHEISIQMDNISKNQISVQVQNQKQEISIQYAPNVLDHSIGMPRQQAQISIQANPLIEEVSIQYSAKPVFINVDQSYETANEVKSQDQNNISQSRKQQNYDRSQDFSIRESVKQSVIQQSFSNDQSYITTRIKKPDQLLQPQLQLDINEKLMKRQAEIKMIQDEKREKQRLKIISEFHKKQSAMQRPMNYQVNKVVEQVFIPAERNNGTKAQNQQSGTIMDSRFDILNTDGPREFQSSESRVQKRVYSENNEMNQSIGGQKSEQMFIEMLSGKKVTTQQNRSENPHHKQQRIFYKQNNRILNSQQQQQDELQDSNNEISLNMTNQMQSMIQQSNNYHHLNKNNNNQEKKEINYKFQNKNEIYHGDNDDDYQGNLEQQQSQQQHNGNQTKMNNNNNLQQYDQLSKQYTKSISTKNMTRINKNQPYSHQNNQLLQQGSLINSSSQQNDLQNSFSSQHNPAQQIIFSPLKYHLNQQNNNNNNILNFVHKQSNHHNNNHNNQQQSLEPSYDLHQDYQQSHPSQYFTQNFTRNLKSATLNYNHHQPKHSVNQLQIQFNHDDDDDSIAYQHQYQTHHSKQQPLPLPQDQIHNLKSHQNQQLEFGDSEKVLISPLNTSEIKGISKQVSDLPQGVNPNFSKSRTKKQSMPKIYKKSSPSKNMSKKTLKRSSTSRQKPLQNELLNPSTSLKRRSITKQLQREEKKAENRKKNIELMEGMLERPSNSKKPYMKEDEQEKRRSDVEKIYLNRQNFMLGK